MPRSASRPPPPGRRRILLAGPSEGALLAAALAARGAPVIGVALLSSSAVPGEHLLRWQARRIPPTPPAPMRGLLRLLRTDLERKAAATHTRIKATTTDVARIGGARVNVRWMREFMAHDPREDLRRLAVPVLALTGGKDLQVDPADLEVVADLVPAEVTTRLVPELTHTLRPVDAEVLETVVAWARRTADRSGAPTG